jgi:hypothetical protein
VIRNWSPVHGYFSFGVEEVWYVYPKLLQVYQFVAGREPRILELDGVLESELLPGFSLAVKTLFSPPGFSQNCPLEFRGTKAGESDQCVSRGTKFGDCCNSCVNLDPLAGVGLI